MLALLSAWYVPASQLRHSAVLMVSAFAGVEALGLGLRAAWRAMLGFQMLRLVTFAARLDRAPTK